MDNDALKQDFYAGMSLRALEAKYGVPRSTIADRAKNEHWHRASQPATRTVFSGHPAQRVRTPGSPVTRENTGPGQNTALSQTKNAAKSKPIRGSRHDPPTNAFSKRNTLAQTHGGYSRRMRLPEAVKADIRYMALRDELEAVRGANMLVADDIGRLRELLKLECDPELRASLQEEKRQAENALLRNIARIESLERSIVYVEHAGPKMVAETERTAAQGEKTRLESEIMGQQRGGHITPIGEIVAEIQKMEHSGLINRFPESNFPDDEFSGDE